MVKLATKTKTIDINLIYLVKSTLRIVQGPAVQYRFYK